MGIPEEGEKSLRLCDSRSRLRVDSRKNVGVFERLGMVYDYHDLMTPSQTHNFTLMVDPRNKIPR